MPKEKRHTITYKILERKRRLKRTGKKDKKMNVNRTKNSVTDGNAEKRKLNTTETTDSQIISDKYHDNAISEYSKNEFDDAQIKSKQLSRGHFNDSVGNNGFFCGDEKEDVKVYGQPTTFKETSNRSGIIDHKENLVSAYTNVSILRPLGGKGIYKNMKRTARNGNSFKAFVVLNRSRRDHNISTSLTFKAVDRPNKYYFTPSMEGVNAKTSATSTTPAPNSAAVVRSLSKAVITTESEPYYQSTMTTTEMSGIYSEILKDLPDTVEGRRKSSQKVKDADIISDASLVNSSAIYTVVNNAKSKTGWMKLRFEKSSTKSDLTNQRVSHTDGLLADMSTSTSIDVFHDKEFQVIPPSFYIYHSKYGSDLIKIWS